MVGITRGMTTVQDLEDSTVQDSDRGGYYAAKRCDDFDRGGANKRRINKREDWLAENDLR
jgi:hypothetical protein